MYGFLHAFLVLLAFGSKVFLFARAEGCNQDAIVVYRITFETFWTEENFPKNYPHYRPPAQWSQLFGQTHNESYSLYHIGDKSSPGLQNLAEKGDLESLNVAGYRDPRIFDQFIAPAIKSGSGSTEAEFFVGKNHSKVSVASRLIPSPDWFVGVDAFELCRHGSWVDAVSFTADPLDAGTDEGLTFTAPNWRSDPQGSVAAVTSRYPPHPAGSFFYPEMEKLPPIANFRFVKIKEFSTQANANEERESLSDCNEESDAEKNIPKEQTDSNNDIESPQNDQSDDQARKVSAENEPRSVPSNALRIKKHNTYEILLKLAKSQATYGGHHSPRHFRSRLLREQSGRDAEKDCVVSEWSDWSPCSQSCGFGERTRRRDVIRWPAEGGRACPTIADREFCGSATLCRQASYFNW